MTVKHASQVPEEPVAAGTKTTRQVLIGPDQGPHFAMRRFIMRPGGLDVAQGGPHYQRHRAPLPLSDHAGVGRR